ncbi:MAG: hypothetical protein WD379_06010 [Dehalococcoidia bacterium]
MRLLLALSLVALALFAACKESDSSPEEASVTPDDPEATATLEVQRPSFRLEYNATDATAEWEAVEEADAYRVAGHVIWWPDCSAGDGIDPVTLEIDEELPPDTRDYPLPRPDAEIYTSVKEFLLLVTAVNPDDDVIAYQNTGQSDERICAN